MNRAQRRGIVLGVAPDSVASLLIEGKQEEQKSHQIHCRKDKKLQLHLSVPFKGIKNEI